MTKDFWYSLALGEQGEATFEHWMRSHDNIKEVKKLDHIKDFVDKGYEYDYHVTTLYNKVYAMEVKSLAGANAARRPYNNAVIEVWADDKKTRRPGWMRSVEAGALDYLIFFNRFKKAFYVYDAKQLYQWAIKQQYLTFANGGNRDSPGWITLLSWEEYGAGFMGKKRWLV